MNVFTWVWRQRYNILLVLVISGASIGGYLLTDLKRRSVENAIEEQGKEIKKIHEHAKRMNEQEEERRALEANPQLVKPPEAPPPAH
jgi:hypothetical protein